MGFPGGAVVKNPPTSAWDTGDVGLVSRSGRSPRERNDHSPSFLAWRIPWTEEPRRQQSTGSQRVGHD